MSNQVIYLLIDKTEFVSDKLLPQIMDSEKFARCIREAQQFDLREAAGDGFYYDLVRMLSTSQVILNYTNLLNGPFTVSETITADNGAIGKVVSDAAGVLTLNNLTGNWSGALSITGGSSTATADVTLVNVDKYIKLMQGEEYVNTAGQTIIFSGLRMALKYWAYARHLAQIQNTEGTHGYNIKTNQYSKPVESRSLAMDIASARSGAVSYWNEAIKYLDNKKSDFPLWRASDCAPERNTRGGITITAVGGCN